MKAITDLLEQTARVLQRSRQEWVQTAQGFNSFTLLDAKEIVQTRIIAGLLDPCGNHGQGDTFLGNFLSLIGEGGNKSADMMSASIRREVMTRTLDAPRRRIDLLITLPNGRAIAVESKARGANDQPRQIEDYLAYLEQIKPQDNVLIYLSPRAIKPHDVLEKQWTNWTQGLSPRLRPFDYDQLINKWLKLCRDKCDSRAVGLTAFLTDFSKLSTIEDERSPLMAIKTRTNVAETVVRNRESVSALFAIRNSCEEVRIKLASKFLTALERRIREALPDQKWTVRQSPLDAEGYIGIELRAPGWQTLSATFQIGPDEPKRQWFETLGLGIQCGGESATEQEKQLKKKTPKAMKDALGNALPHGRDTSQWVWFQSEFEKMSEEQVACVLYDCSSDDLTRLVKSLIRVAEAVRECVESL